MTRPTLDIDQTLAFVQQDERVCVHRFLAGLREEDWLHAPGWRALAPADAPREASATMREPS